MENNNYVSVGNIIEQERLKRQAQIAKGVSSDVYDHIEKAHQDDLSKGVEMTDNLSRFADDVDNLNKAETEFLLSKLQRQINADPESQLLKSFKSIAINHLNDLEKAWNVGDEKQYQGVTYYVGGFNSKGQPLWRKKKEGGSVSDKKAGASQTQSSISDLASKINANIEVVLKVAGVESYSNVVDVKATDSSIIIKYNDDGGHLHTLPLTKGVAQSVLKEVNKQKKNDKASSSTVAGSKVDISKIPDAEFKRITQMLEKKNPDHRDAERYLEEEAMSDKELKNFHAVAEHFKNSSKINKLTQEYCRKWAELARQELQSRKKNR